jgi:hypothetical protein
MCRLDGRYARPTLPRSGCRVPGAGRRVWLAGITTNPIGPWVAQQARQLLMDLGEHADRFQLLIRDRRHLEHVPAVCCCRRR